MDANAGTLQRGNHLVDLPILWSESRILAEDDVAGALTNFPVYIDLSTMPAKFWAGVSSGCGDIRVFASDKVTELPREVVTCSTGAKTGELWFKAPALSTTADNVFYINFGSGAADYATNATNGAQNVWTNSYAAVYHLKDGSSLSGADSTSNGNNGTVNSASATAGELDGGASFSGTASNITTASTYSIGTSNLTISGWVNLSGTSLHGAFVKLGNTTTGYGVGVGSTDFDTNGNNFLMLFENIRWITSATAYGTGWHHFDMVVDGSGTPTGYRDGASLGASSGTGPVSPAGATTQIGGYTSATPTNRFCTCTLDQIEISNVARSAAWIQTEYNNQSSPGTFYGAGLLYLPLLKIYPQ